MARSAISAALTLFLGIAGLFVTAVPASAAPVLTVTPITWNIVGLDHNDPTNSGPDTFASGARACNTGDATATNVVANYLWDSSNAYINTTGLTTLTETSLAAGACTDFYFNIVVTRTNAAFGTARRFHIEVSADGLGVVSTPTPREIYVEQLRSQNRNTIDSITGPSNVVVGNTYTYVLTSSTSSTFEQWSSFLNFPNFAFQIKSVSATYTQPAGATNSTIYADACGFQQNPTLPNYRSCVGPANYAGGAVGGTATTTYQVKILSAGAFGINALIYDKSGGSYHYNSDWGNGGESVVAVEEVDLSITKTDSADPVIAGNNLTYTINVTNAGPSTAHNVTISDPLPAGTSFVSASNGGTNSAGTVSWSIGDLAAGASVSRTLTVNVNSSRTAALSNTATVSTTTTDTNAANNSVTQATTVNTSADLSLTKTDASDPVARGSNVSYTLTASNAGPSDAQNVQISDPLPAGVSFVSATPSQGSCSQAAGTVTCSLGTITAGANATATVVLTPNVDGSITNTATVSSTTSDPSNANNSASQGTTISPRADVSITKTDSSDPVTAGNNVTYTLTATNNGPSTAQNVQISDPIPTGTTFVSASNGATPVAGTVTWSIGALASGASVNRTVTVNVNASRTNPVSNTASVSTTTTDPSGGNNSAIESTAVATSADVSLTKTDDADPVAVGANLTYTLTASNAGPSDAAGVQITDPLPAGVSFVSVTPSQGSCSYAAGPRTVTCPLGTVASGANATVTVVVKADNDGSLTNTASVSATTSDPNNANNGASQGTTVNALADVSITKTDSTDPVTAGTNVTYTITATNNGPSTAQNVQITDAIPAGTTFVSASNGGTPVVGTVTWSLGNLASGASAVRTLTVKVDASRTTAISNTATVSTTTADPSAGNDSATQGTAVASSADLQVSKTDSADPVAVGQNVTYTIELHNAGPSDAQGVQITDALPNGMAFVSATAPCNHAAGTVTCALGSLAVDADATITVTVTPTTDGTFSNTATVSSTTSDPSAANDSDTETTDATPIADLSVSKTDAVASVTAGTSTAYTITVTNHGPSAVPAGVEITDTLPAGVVGSENDARCDLVGQTVTCTTAAGLAVGASTSFDVDAAVDPGYVGANLANTASITDTPYVDPDPSDDTSTDTDGVDRVADLGVSVVDLDDPIALGETVTDTITVTNAGPSDASGVVVAGALPANTTLVGGDPACSVVVNVITCSVGVLAAGDSVDLDVVLAPSVEGDVQLSVGVASAATDPNPGNDADDETTTVEPSANLSIDKTDDADPVGTGSPLTYTLEVHNSGPSVAEDVEVVDDLPAGLDFVSASDPGCAEAAGAVTCLLGDLADGATVSIDIVVTPTGDGGFINEASVSSTTDDPDPSDDDAVEGTTVTPAADLRVTKSDGALSVVAGTSTTYTITVHNVGPSSVPAGVEVSDSLPNGVQIASLDADCAVVGADVTCTTTGLLAPGDAETFDVTVDVDADYADPDLSNTAAVSASPYVDPDATNDTDTDVDTVDTEADLELDVVEGPDPVAFGTALPFTITVTNHGPSDAADVEASAPLPAGTTVASLDPACSETAGTITCAVAALAVGDDVSFDIVVTPSTHGAVTLDAAVASSTTDTNAANDTDSETTTVLPSADVSIVKTAAPDPVGVGEDLTYTLTVHNDGPSGANDVEITDVLPGTLVFVDADPTAGSCNEAGGTVTCDLGTLANGATETVEIVVTPTTDGVVANQGTVASSTPDPDGSDNASIAAVTVDPVADLEVTKTNGQPSVVAGSSTTYTLTLTNHGPSDVAAGVEITDTLPGGATPTAADADCVIAGQDVTCTTSSPLAAGDSVALLVEVDVAADFAGATLSNTATITSSPISDPDPTNDAATDDDAIDRVADLGVDIVSDTPDPVLLGNDVTYTIDVDNAGPSDADDVDVELTIPAGMTFSNGDPECAAAGTIVTCSLATLATGDGHTFSVTLSPVSTGVSTLDAQVTSSATDPNGANDSDSEDTDVQAPPVVDADLSVSISDAPDPVTVGGTYTYTLLIENGGPANAFGVNVEQVLPAGASFVSATPDQGSCTEAAGTVSCALGAIAVGGSVTISVVVDAPAVVGAADSTATVTALSPDPNGANDVDTETTNVVALSADLSLTKTDGTTTVTAGGWTTYTLTLSNAGPDAAPAGVVVTDTVPAGTSASTSDPRCNVAGATVTCTTSSPLVAGDTTSFDVVMSVDADLAAATVDNTAQIFSSPVGDPDPSDDDATDTDDVVTRADLTLTISDTPDPVVLGNDVTYTLHVHNGGPSDAANVLITSALPAELDFVSAPAGCSFGLGVLVCDAGTVPDGGDASFDLVLRPNVTGAVALDATVGSATTDPVPGDNSATEATTVLAAPPPDVDLGVSIADAPDPVNENGTLTYTLGVANTGPGDATGVEVTQQLPNNTVFQSASAGCSHAAGVVTCTVGAVNSGASANAAVIVSAPSSVQALSSTVSVTTTSNDTNAANDSATTSTTMQAAPPGPASADLGVVVTDTPDPVDAGGSVTYSIGVHNAGPDTATGTVVTFTLPPGAIFTGATPLQGSCSGTAVVTCTLGALNSGASTTISVVAVLTTTGTATASASVTSAVADPVAGNNAASTSTTVNAVADLSLSKTDGVATVAAGTSTTYTITLSNAGPSPAGAGVVVVDHIPPGTTAHVTDPSCAIAGSNVTCTTTAPLAANATVSWQVTLDIPADYTGAGVDNSATIQSSPTTDPVAANDTATDHDDVTAATADLSILKEDVPDPVFAGEKITYTITVSNAGPGTAEDVVVTDAVPAATEVKEIQDGGTETDGVVSWNLGTLAAGQSVSVHLVVLVDVNHDGDVSNTATVASTTSDPDATDNSATAVTTDDPAGVDLELEKRVDANSVVVGEIVTYTIVVSNAGPADATGVVVEDALPKGLDHLSSKADRGAYDDATGKWSVGDLAAGEDATLDIRTKITGEAAGTLRNVATVAGVDQTDQTPANDRADAEVEVLADDVEIVDPVADDEVLAFTGLNFGLAFQITLVLLILGASLMMLGRRFERTSRRAD